MNPFSDPCDLVVKALRNVQAGLGGAMAPTGKVDTGRMKYKHLELDVILTTALPLLAENGLTLMHTQDQHGVDCIVIHESGQWLRSRAQVGIDEKMGAQEIGSALTYGRRYSLTAILGLAAGDDDGASAHKAKKEPADTKQAELSAKIEKVLGATNLGTLTPEVDFTNAADRDAFLSAIQAAGVDAPYSELCNIAVKAGRPTPGKMSPEVLTNFTKYVIKLLGGKSAEAK